MAKTFKITKEEFLEFTKNEPKTIQQVAEHFKVTEQTIDNLLKREKLPSSILCKQKRGFKISKEQFLEFTKNEPKTQKELAEHFNVKTSAIYCFLKRHKLPLLGRKKGFIISKEKFLEFVKNEPKTIKELAEHFNVKRNTIYCFLKRHTLPLSILCKQKKINLINKKQ
jgi:predicted transcriptional regulator